MAALRAEGGARRPAHLADVPSPVRGLSQTHAVRPLRATFLTFGFFWGTWAVVALDVQRFLDFSDAQLGLLLAATVVGGSVANGAGGVIAERYGTRLVLSSALAGWATLLVLL